MVVGARNSTASRVTVMKASSSEACWAVSSSSVIPAAPAMRPTWSVLSPDTVRAPGGGGATAPHGGRRPAVQNPAPMQAATPQPQPEPQLGGFSPQEEPQDEDFVPPYTQLGYQPAGAAPPPAPGQAQPPPPGRHPDPPPPVGPLWPTPVSAISLPRPMTMRC